MSVDAPVTEADVATTLAQTAAALRGMGDRRPAARVVEAALRQAEKQTRQQRSTFPLALLSGQWRLGYVIGAQKARNRSGIFSKHGIYVPRWAHAQISFAPATEADGTIGNQVQIGKLALQLTGVCRYHSPKNLLDFDFTQVQIQLWGRTLYQQEIRGGAAKAETFYAESIATHPFFAFFWVTPDCIAARGRSGGIALWVRAD